MTVPSAQKTWSFTASKVTKQLTPVVSNSRWLFTAGSIVDCNQYKYNFVCMHHILFKVRDPIETTFMFFISRLTRVRQRHEYHTRRLGQSETPDLVSLHKDYAIMCPGEETYRLLKIQRIILAGQYGTKDYRLPVEYNHSKKDSLIVWGTPYNQVKADESGTFFVDGTGIQKVKFSSIFCHVNLQSCNDTVVPMFKLNREDVDILVGETRRLQPPTERCRRVPVRARNVANQVEDFDGIVRTEVQPQPAGEGLRRSRRVRTVISSISGDFV